MKILITGVAGFIGYHLAKKLIDSDYTIVGIDNINDYYDINIKYARLKNLGIEQLYIKNPNTPIESNKYPLNFYKMDIADDINVDNLFNREKFDYVFNSAAQAGVRASLINPKPYIQSNIVGFFNLLQASKNAKVKNFIYASSSSVYGLNEKMPFSVHDNVDHPISLYAASKKSNELMAHSYSYLYNLPTTGLRFFTVYGPWGRPDMALFLFTKNIINNQPIDVYNYGKMQRDFTYIDDIIEAITHIIKKPAKPNKNWNGKTPDPSSSVAPFKVYNIGNNKVVSLMDYIETIEDYLGKKVQKNMLPMQPGDVKATWADVRDLVEDFDYKPSTSIKEGIARFIDWYLDFFNIKK